MVRGVENEIQEFSLNSLRNKELISNELKRQNVFYFLD